MTQQEKQEIDKKCDEFCEYRRTHSNGYPPREWFMAGVKALDEIRKPSEPDKELLEALKKICKVAPSYIKNPDDELDNAICDAMLAVYDYELNEETK